jgi:hypothetical protein
MKLFGRFLKNADPRPPYEEVPNARDAFSGLLAVLLVPALAIYVFAFAYVPTYSPTPVCCLCATGNVTMPNNASIARGDLDPIDLFRLTTFLQDNSDVVLIDTPWWARSSRSATLSDYCSRCVRNL